MVTKEELKQLLTQLKDDEKNLDLINKVALAYMENYEMVTDKEDLYYFEKAYKIKKTVKSTHNLAWQLFFEWGQPERALEIQQECINLKPKSYMPYYFLGHMLLCDQKLHDALKYLQFAYKKTPRKEIVHNIGVTHFRMGDFPEAINAFKEAHNDHDTNYKSLYCLALAYKKAKKLEKLQLTLKELNSKQMGSLDTISGYDLAQLYFEIDDYDSAKRCIVKQGVNGYSFLDWKELTYSIWKTDKALFEQLLNKAIKENQTFINEIKSGHKDWNDETEEEKAEYITDFENDIKALKNLDDTFTKSKPESTIDVIEERGGCLLFDCPRHGVQADDE